MRIRRVMAVVVALNICILGPSAMATNVSIFVTDTLDNRKQNALETTLLDCRRQIFAVISLTSVPQGTHTLIIDWTDPNGRRRESNTQKISHSTREIVTWLKLHPAAGTGVLRAFNPAIGMTSFIGIWNIAISIDGIAIQQTEFEVIC